MPGSSPLITTVIPTYRRPKLLRRAIQSVLNQTYQHFQVCVYDNASGDETALVVRELARHDPRIRYFCHSTNIGALANFQYGLTQVSTPYFSFLSDDDMLLPDFYTSAIEHLSAHRKALFFGGSTLHVNSDGLLLGVSPLGWEEGLYEPPNGLLRMWEQSHLVWTGIVFRREVNEQCGLLDAQYGFFAEVAYELRIARRAPFYVVPRPVAIAMDHNSTASANETLSDIWPGIKLMGERDFNDPILSGEVKARIYRVWQRKVQGALVEVGLRSLIRRRPLDAINAGNLCITHCGRFPKATLLLILAKVARSHDTLATLIAKILECKRSMRIRWLKLGLRKCQGGLPPFTTGILWKGGGPFT